MSISYILDADYWGSSSDRFINLPSSTSEVEKETVTDRNEAERRPIANLDSKMTPDADA